ncbi:Crp/Fnr family transcriptional regulator [Nevskia sp.]|uniref:Crp/Fnr family transcriptional regulator n=1 Tax=Nevskia sp. TaxID=1929292 RepID=UPI0025F64FA6|nr:Crp/Fnr family transcriptional regulator [Nevskia sp.]
MTPMIPLSAPHNFYDTLPPEARAAIDAASCYLDLCKGARVMAQGQPSDHLHQILSGEVKVSSTSREGRETVIALIRGGGWVSLSEIFSGLPANADVTALTPVRVRSLARTALLELMGRYPQIAEELLRVLSQRFSILYHFSVDRDVLTLKERVIKTLYMQALSHGLQSGEVTIALPQEELGKLLAGGRQALNRVLKELEREGLLEASYGGVRLLGLEVLRSRYGYLVDVDEPVAVYRD